MSRKHGRTNRRSRGTRWHSVDTGDDDLPTRIKLFGIYAKARIHECIMTYHSPIRATKGIGYRLSKVFRTSLKTDMIPGAILSCVNAGFRPILIRISTSAMEDRQTRLVNRPFKIP